jgi:valyl-tRNA synthetase
VTIAVDTSTAIDVAAEKSRAQRDLAAARKELGQTAGKLGNPAFLEKAPEAVVAQISARYAAASADVDRLTARLADLEAGG